MSRPLFARPASRSAIECVVPWTDEARFSADRWEQALEMLAEKSDRYRIWLVSMDDADRAVARFDDASEAMGRWSRIVRWKERGQRGLDRLNVKLDESCPDAIRLIADLGRPFRASELSEAMLSGKRRPTSFGMGVEIAAATKFERTLAGSSRIDAAEPSPFASRPAVAESETGARRLRPMGKIQKIRAFGA